MGSEEGKERTEDGKRRGRSTKEKRARWKRTRTPSRPAKRHASKPPSPDPSSKPALFGRVLFIITLRSSTSGSLHKYLFLSTLAGKRSDGRKLGLRCSARTRRHDENTNGAGAAAKRRPSPFLAVRACLELESLRKKRACTQRARKGYALPHPSCRSSSSTGSSRRAVPISSIGRPADGQSLCCLFS